MDNQQQKDLAVGTEAIDYRYDFTKEEIESIRAEHTDKMIEQEIIEDEIKAFRDERAPKIKTLKASGREMRKKIRTGYETRNEQCHLVPDFENSVMQYFSIATGDLVFSRKLRPNEKNLTIMHAMAV
jgi:hypothetical protein